MKTSKIIGISMAFILLILFSSTTLASEPAGYWKINEQDTIRLDDFSTEEFYYSIESLGYYGITESYFDTEYNLVSTEDIISWREVDSGGASGTIEKTYYKPGKYVVDISSKDKYDYETQHYRLFVYVTCTDSDNDGVCDDDEKQFTKITVTATPDSGYAPLEVDFTCSAEGGNEPLNYYWNFGDGKYSLVQNPTHVYQNVGTYTATCKVMDNDNDGISDNVVITVSKEPINILPVAKFVATPDLGYAPLNVKFDASASYDYDGVIVSYEWYLYGDNTPFATGMRVTETFDNPGQYKIKLVVTDDDGATDDSWQVVTVNEKPNVGPVAKFAADPMSGYAPLEVDFDASGSYDSDGIIVSYEWYLESSYLGSGIYYTNTFNNPGHYRITLFVTDDDGVKDSTSKTIIVNKPEPENRAPIADFKFDPSNPEVYDVVTFDASDSYDPDGDVLTYSWDYDADGTIDATGITATNSYDEPGTYKVGLVVNDGELSDQSVKTITVTAQLDVDSIVCLTPVVVNHKQSCGVSVLVKGEPIQDAEVSIYFEDGTLFGTCQTTKGGDCRAEMVMEEIGFFTVYATATKPGYVEDLDKEPTYDFEVYEERYEIRDLEVFEDSEFTIESYDFFRGEDLYVQFKVYEMYTGEIVNENIVTKATLVSTGDETADLDEIMQHNDYFRYELTPIPLKYDFIGDSQIFAFAFNFSDGSGGQQEIGLIIRNNPPMIFPEVEDIIIYEGETYTIDLSYHEFDLENSANSGDDLYWEARENTQNVDIELNDKQLTITGLKEGTIEIELTLFDYDDDDDEQTFKVKVIKEEPENKAPVLDSIGNKQVYELDNLEFEVTGSDPDGDDLIFTTSVLPSGATFVANEFDWTPEIGQNGIYYVTFSVTDGELSDSETIEITVLEEEQEELVANIGDPYAGVVGKKVRFDATASIGDIVTYVYEFGDSEQESRTSPYAYYAYTEEGTYTVTLTVIDGNGNTDTDTAEVVIEEAEYEEERVRQGLYIGNIDVYGLYSNEDYKVASDDELVVTITMQNSGDKDLKDLKITAMIPELGVKMKTASFSLDEGDRTTKTMYLPVYDAIPGEYYVRLVIGNTEATRVKHRYFIVE